MDSFDEKLIVFVGSLFVALVGALFRRNLRELDNTMCEIEKSVKSLRDEVHGKDSNDGIKSRLLLTERKIKDQEELSEKLSNDIKELRRQLSDHSKSTSDQLTDVKIGLSECVGMLKTLMTRD